MTVFISVLLLSLMYLPTMATFTPTAPGPGDVFAAGSMCSIQWKPDIDGVWTNVTIDLMSGSNDNMTSVANVASGLDGSDASLMLYNWTCPEVKPYAPIYFYQFTQPGEASQWTARFTITSPQGDSMPAPADTQPNGDSIAWGERRLAGDTASKDDAPPVAHSKTLKERPSGSDSDGAASDGTGDDGSASSTDSDGGSGSNWRNSVNKAAAEGSATALTAPSSTGPARPRKSRMASSHFTPTLSLPPALLAHTPSATPSDAPDDSDSNGAQHATASSFLVFVSFVSCLSFMRAL